MYVCMFTCASVNMFTNDLANMFTSALANMFTSASANMFTSDLANMFTSELEKCKKFNLANMFFSDVDWWICWSCTRNMTLDPKNSFPVLFWDYMASCCQVRGMFSICFISEGKHDWCLHEGPPLDLLSFIFYLLWFASNLFPHFLHLFVLNHFRILMTLIWSSKIFH